MPLITDTISLKNKVVEYLAIFGILCASHFIVGIFCYKEGENSKSAENSIAVISQLKEHQRTLITQQKEFNESVSGLNNKLQGHNETVKIITKNVEKEIEKPVYRDTIVPPDGMQLLANNASSLNSKRVSNFTLSEVQNVTKSPDK